MSIVRELKRRNILRVAIAYVIIAWLILQVGDVLAPALRLADWVNTALAFFLILGFPIAMLCAWAFELTPDGLKKEKDVDRTQSITHKTGRKIDFAIIALLSVALVFFASTHQWSDKKDSPDGSGIAAEHSIAVLPFVNMSSDPEQEYFSDGLTEELLNLLAGIDELKVAARTSSFYYKDKRDEVTLTEIATQLGVAHVLEGSVRKSGDKIRITAQLIKADDGFHLWSSTFDRTLDDIFEIQDEISAAVVDELKITLLGEAPRARVSNTEAYELVLQGRFFFNRRADGDLDRAREYFERAVELDSGIAEAWSGLVPLYTWGSDSPDVPRARAAAEKALAIEPDNPEAHIRMALVYSFEDDWAAAQREADIALELGPDNPLVLGVHAGAYVRNGDIDKGIEYQQRAASIDPLSAVNHNNLASYLDLAGRFEEALAAFNRAEELNPGELGRRKLLGRIRLQQGHVNEALEIFQALPDDWEKLYYLSMAYYSLENLQASDAAMTEFQEKYSSEFPVGMAGMHAWRGDADSAFLWLRRAREISPDYPGYAYDPFLRTLHSDPRWAALRD